MSNHSSLLNLKKESSLTPELNKTSLKAGFSTGDVN